MSATAMTPSSKRTPTTVKQEAAVPDTTTTTLPPALGPVWDALAALSDLRQRLAQAEATMASAATGEAAAQRRAEDLLGAGEDASGAMAEAERHRHTAVSARATATGLCRRIAQAEAELPGIAEQGRQALHAFGQDCAARLDARYRKLAGQMLGVLSEATAIRWATGNADGAFLLGKIKLPQSLADLSSPWKGVGAGMGDIPAEPSDAGRQLAEAARLLGEVERIATDVRWRRDQPQAA